MAAAWRREKPGVGQLVPPGSWGELLVDPVIWVSCVLLSFPVNQKGERFWVRKVGVRLGLRGEINSEPRSLMSCSRLLSSPSSVRSDSCGRD